MPPTPTSFDVLVHGDRPILSIGLKPLTVRMRQQCSGYRGLQTLAKSPQHLPGSITGIVATAQFAPKLS